MTRGPGPVRRCPILIGSQSWRRATDPLAALHAPAHRNAIQSHFRLRLLRHVGRCREYLAFLFQWSTAERAVGWRLGIYAGGGILYRRFTSPEWPLTLPAARLLRIAYGTPLENGVA